MDGDSLATGVLDVQAPAAQVAPVAIQKTEQQVTSNANVGTQRVFTQDELNAIVGDRVKTYKTTIDKSVVDLEAVRKDKAELELKLQGLEYADSLRKNKVSEDYFDFVKFEAGKEVKEGKSFNDCLVEYLKTHPQYTVEQNSNSSGSKTGSDAGVVGKQQTGIKGSSSGHGSSSGSVGDDGSEAYDAIMRKKGYIK